MAAPQNTPYSVTDQEDNESTDLNEEVPLIQRPNAIFADDIKSAALNNAHDIISASWNGWEQACKYGDEGLANYYMEMVVVVNAFKNKLARVVKKDK